ncbi:uncharacterized protein LOC132886937 isoform X1 [Neoarius graeffei]|uniref:uncharacterized protein LOC132886937 isoform X1 n=1 Tax=Neoarius graeffei TaxID=443677 RepID=UPI00298CC4DC|nr:uncharacterized protein LOC132886937 isoform X1 [Neoarius graeffei]
MKGSIPCTKASFLLFVLLQTSLILYASAQNATNSTVSPTTAVNVTSLTIQTSNTTVASSVINGTNSTTVFCPVSSCNYSACYSTFTSTNVTTCSTPESFCELRRDGDRMYSVRCTSTCLSACTNTSQNNCSINCCSNSCVNSTLNSLLNNSNIMTTTTAATTTPSTTTASTAKDTTVASTIMATNGKKCQKFSCTGKDCYKGNTDVVLCAPGQNFCMLKMTQDVTVTTWTASCIEDCRKETVCTPTSNNCIQECCNATTTSSCLKLNGEVNVVGSGTMAPFSHLPLLVSSFFLWLLMMGKSAN